MKFDFSSKFTVAQEHAHTIYNMSTESERSFSNTQLRQMKHENWMSPTLSHHTDDSQMLYPTDN